MSDSNTDMHRHAYKHVRLVVALDSYSLSLSLSFYLSVSVFYSAANTEKKDLS